MHRVLVLSIVIVLCGNLEGLAIDTLKLSIPTGVLYSLDSCREKALDARLIYKDCKKTFTATLASNNKEYPISIRLKGDKTDHLRAKTSFRIKMKGDGTYMGMKKFSIQHPGTRRYTNEWLLHKVLMQEDILTTRYEYVLLQINGEDKGVYAIEEHFDTALSIAQDRKEPGVILKFDEEVFWAFQLYASNGERSLRRARLEYPIFQAVEILPFAKKSILSSKRRTKQLTAARGKLEKFRSFEHGIKGMLDIERFAKYYALCDLFNAYHGLMWINQRYYYNPNTKLLEPVAYDCSYPKDRPHPRGYLANTENDMNRLKYRSEYLIYFPFNTPEFANAYWQYVTTYTDSTYIQNIFSSHGESLGQIDSLLSAEFDQHQPLKKEKIFNRASELRKNTSGRESSLSFSCLSHDELLKEIPSEEYPDVAVPDSLFRWGVKSYCYRKGRKWHWEMANYHPRSVQVMAVRTDKGWSRLKTPIALDGYSFDEIVLHRTTKKEQILEVEVQIGDSELNIPSFPWKCVTYD